MGKNCKYNGENNFSEKIAKLAEKNELIPVCPEVLGGLPVPRKPCEIVSTNEDNEIKAFDVITKDGISCKKEYLQGAEKALKIALEKKIDFAILKSRSPSCGKGFVYDGTFSHTLKEGNGIFANLLLENNIKTFTEEDEYGIQN